MHLIRLYYVLTILFLSIASKASGKYVPINKTDEPYNLNNFPAGLDSLEKQSRAESANGN